MKTRSLWLLSAALVCCFFACEDGPEQIFSPNTGDIQKQNGYSSSLGWTIDESKDFSIPTGKDKEGSAKFCSEDIKQGVNQFLVQQDIVPNVSLGGIPLWNEENKPISADELVGPVSPEELEKNTLQKFCSPEKEWISDGILYYAYGANFPVVALFNPETRQIIGIIARGKYEGALKGTYTRKEGQLVPIKIKTTERIQIGEKTLDTYATDESQPGWEKSWLNPQNMNKIYKMLRETYFGTKLPEDFDCYKERLCAKRLSGTSAEQQNSVLLFADSKTYVVLSPEGHVLEIRIFLDRKAPFENSDNGQPKLSFFGENNSPSFLSHRLPSCRLSFDEKEANWEAFQAKCIDSSDENTLKRAEFSTNAQRDTLRVSFSSMSLNFARNTFNAPLFEDGQKPIDSDTLVGFGFSVDLQAVVQEFVPAKLAQDYLNGLARQLAEYKFPGINNEIIESGATSSICPIPTILPPLQAKTSPTILGKLLSKAELIAIESPIKIKQQSWILEVVDVLQSCYKDLPDNLKEQSNRTKILNKGYLIEPYTRALHAALTNNLSEQNESITRIEISNDESYVFTTSHFVHNGTPYRLISRFDIMQGEVTYIYIDSGFNEVDELYNNIHARLTKIPNYKIENFRGPYYSLAESTANSSIQLGEEIYRNPLSLGAKGINVKGFDRKLQTLDVELTIPGENEFQTISFKAPGLSINDNNGCYKQIRGQTYEFIPANVVRLEGRETDMQFCIKQEFVETKDGQTRITQVIDSVTQYNFKGKVNLCPGLSIRYGDNVLQKLKSWKNAVNQRSFDRCLIVLNYSENNNVLQSIASLAYKTNVSTSNQLAVHATIWR